MNTTIFRKALRDYGWMMLVAAALLFAFVIIFVFAATSINIEQRLDVMQTPWVRRLISSMIGGDIIDNFTRTGMIAFAFAHPAAWAMLLTFILTSTSGLIAGEVDHGSFDLVATLPISRTRLYVTYSVVVALAVAVMCAAIWAGACAGLSLIGDHEAGRSVLAIVAAHLYAACLFVVGLGMAMSGVCNRRLVAAGICFLYIFYSFVLNVLEAFWPAIRSIGFSSFMHYYSPLPVARDAAWQWTNIGVLLAAGLVVWLIGLVRFVNRDLPGA
ncbi:MAG: ABC transporter permease subunit [Phycisphaerales bacterium]|nr:ABC transporter permease subunit [Phycisphaerales bacterium]